jgi:hypothetical protein
MPESVSDPASREMPARVADSSRKMPAPVSTSSALLVETGSVAIKIAKDHDTSNLYTVTTVQQNIAINAKSYIPTTESLATALQSTMTTTTNRQPVIIPGTRKRVGSVAQTGELSKSQHLSPLLRHGLPLGAITAFILFSLFSLSSLADGYTQVPIVGNAIQWVQNEQTNWSLLIGDHAPIMQTGPTPQASDPGSLPASDYVAIARQAAISAGIPPNYFVLQIKEESNFNPNAVSPAGAVGIAQFEPSTAAGLGINPYDPVASLYGAARYMARLDNSYGGDYAKALAAYNAGPPAVTRAVNSGGANWLAYMPAETQRYVHAIMG